MMVPTMLSRLGRLALCAAALGAMPMVPAVAQDGGSVVGDWAGTLDWNGRPVPVRLKVDAVPVGQPAGQIRFMQPHTCTNPVSVRGPSGGGTMLNLNATTAGPFCAANFNGSLTLKAASGGLDGNLARQGGGTTFGVKLVPAASVPPVNALKGVWNGSVARSDGPVPVELRLDAVRPGEKAGTLFMRPPMNCEIAVELSGRDAAGAFVLTPFGQTAGPCVRFALGALTLTVSGGTAKASMGDPTEKGKALWTADLNRG